MLELLQRATPHAPTQTRQLPVFSYLGVEHGLSQGQILAMAQDQQGMLWFGTQEGLSRYDGYTFYNYFADPTKPGHLANDWIWTLLVDYRGKLWVGTDGGGLYQYDPETDQFKSYRHNPSDAESLASDRVSVLFQDRRRRLWIGTYSGLQMYLPEHDAFVSYQLPTDDTTHFPQRLHIRALAETAQGSLWVGTEGAGLAYFTPATGHFTWLQETAFEPQLLHIRSLYTSPDNVLWIGTYDHGLFHRTGCKEPIKVPAHPVTQQLHNERARIRQIQSGENGQIWITTDAGLLLYQRQDQTYTLMQHAQESKRSIRCNDTFALLRTRNGQLWVTNRQGVDYWDPHMQLFDRFVPDNKNLSALSGTMILGFAQEPSGDIWIATYDGLHRLDARAAELDTYTKSSTGKLGLRGLRDDRIMAIHLDPKGQLWIGTREHGLALLDRRRQQFAHFGYEADDDRSLPSNAISMICDAEHGRLWVVTFGGGLALFDPATGRCQRYCHEPDNPNSLSSNELMSVCPTKNGDVWIATRHGLNRLSPQKQRITRYRHDPNKATSLGHDYVNCVTQDHEGNIWVGTQGGGLSLLPAANVHQDQERFIRFGRHQGLKSTVIYGIVEDQGNHLWLSSNSGLVKLNPMSGHFAHFGPEHGLQGYEFNTGAYYRSANGQFFFGGCNGFNAFYPENIKLKQHPDAPVFMALRTPCFQLTTPEQINRQGKIRLSDKDIMLQVDVSTLSFSQCNQLRYRYQLQGFDEQWVELRQGRTITYTNLPTGEYLLEVEATTAQGEWSTNSASLAIKVNASRGKIRWQSLLTEVKAPSPVWLAQLKRSVKKRPQSEFQKRVAQEVARRTHSLRMQNKRLLSMNHELTTVNAELERLNSKLLKTSFIDPLTGLHNRQYIEQQLESWQSDIERRAPRESENASAPKRFLLLVDVEQMHAINDQYGRHVGDQVLLKLTDMLRLHCRATDTLARWSGDAILLSGLVSSMQDVEQLALQIQMALSAEKAKPDALPLSVSMGFSTFPFITRQPEYLSIHQVLRITEWARDLAHQQGTGGWAGLSEGLVPPPANSLMELLEFRLAQAIERKQVTLSRSPAG